MNSQLLREPAVIGTAAGLALLAVGELMTVAARISNYTFKPIETLTTVGVVYLILGYALSWITYRLERVFKAARA